MRIVISHRRQSALGSRSQDRNPGSFLPAWAKAHWEVGVQVVSASCMGSEHICWVQIMLDPMEFDAYVILLALSRKQLLS